MKPNPTEPPMNGRPRSGSPEYSCWKSMISRCSNPSASGYKHYGARGISVHPMWLGYPHGFQNFVGHIGERPSSEFSIDRINVNGNYEPGNVRWATTAQQARNRRNNRTVQYHGETLCHVDLAEKLGITPQSLEKRARRWSPEDLLTPSHQKRYFGFRSRHNFTKITEDDVLEIKRLIAKGIPYKDIGARFNVHRTLMSHIKSGRCWSHVTDAARLALSDKDRE